MCWQGCIFFFSGSSKGESSSLPSPDSRCCSCSLACGPVSTMASRQPLPPSSLLNYLTLSHLFHFLASFFPLKSMLMRILGPLVNLILKSLSITVLLMFLITEIKHLTGAAKEGWVYLESQSEGRIHHGEEGIEMGTWGIWAHWVHNREAGRWMLVLSVFTFCSV